MKKMKRRIVGVMLIVMLVTIIISPASFSAWANEIDDVSDGNLNTIDAEVEVSEESDTADEDEAEGLEEADTVDADENEESEKTGTVDADENEESEKTGAADADENEESEKTGAADADENKESEEADGSDSDETEGSEETEDSDANEDEKSEEAEDSDANEDEKSEETEDIDAENDAADEDKAEKSKEKTADVTEDKLKKASLGKKTNIKETVHYEVGDTIKFGKYEQDGNEENGKEDIEWQVLKVESDRVLVVSKYALDYRRYNSEYNDVTWETCSLRYWLNNDFKDTAFTPEEQEKIPMVVITNDNNFYYGTDGGNDTSDRVFCLSVNEVNDWIGYSNFDEENHNGFGQNLIVEPTQYAIDRGTSAYTITEMDYDNYLKEYGYSNDVIGKRGVWWWLRSPGSCGKDACYVSGDGNAGAFVNITIDRNGFAVRPALFIDILSTLKKDNDSKRLGVELEGDIISEPEIVEGDSGVVVEEENDSEEHIDEDADIKPSESENGKDNDISEEIGDEDKDDNPEEKEDANTEDTEINPGESDEDKGDVSKEISDGEDDNSKEKEDANVEEEDAKPEESKVNPEEDASDGDAPVNVDEA